jgi:hypothetical protein
VAAMDAGDKLAIQFRINVIAGTKKGSGIKKIEDLKVRKLMNHGNRVSDDMLREHQRKDKGGSAMKKKLKGFSLKMTLTGLFAIAIMFGLTTGSVLAQDDKAKDSVAAQDDKAKYEEWKKENATLSEESKYELWKKNQANLNLAPYLQKAPVNPAGGGNHASLAEAATNPLANLIQFQMQDVFTFDNYNSDSESNTLLIQPVIPVKLPWEAIPIMITRTTLPIVWTPDLGEPYGRQTGFGDTTLLAILNPKMAQGNQLGFGVSLIFPTAGSNEFTGSGKWQAGPSFVWINTQIPKTQIGVLSWHDWSYADGSKGSSRPATSKSSIQPMFVMHFGEGWYWGIEEVPWTYDWKNSQWSMPIGPQLGLVKNLGKQPVKLFAEVLYDPFKPDDDAVSAQWSAKIGITFLFPQN